MTDLSFSASTSGAGSSSSRPPQQQPGAEHLESFLSSLDGLGLPCLPLASQAGAFGLDLHVDELLPAGKEGYEACAGGLGGLAPPPLPALVEPMLADEASLLEELGRAPKAGGRARRGPHARDRDDPQKLKDKIEAQRSKNAKNQKLFRARAKERAQQTQEQLRFLEQQVKSLAAEKDSLRERNIVLEAALASPSMQQQAHAQRLQQQRVCASEEQLQQGFKVSPLLPLRGAPVEALRLELLCSPPRCLSPEDLQGLTFPEFAVIWKEAISVLATLLLDEKAPGFTERVQAVVNEFAALCGRLTLAAPRLMHIFHASSLERPSGVPLGDSHLTTCDMRSIIGILDLSPEQVRELLSQRAIARVGQARVLQDRARLLAEMQVVQGLQGSGDPRLLFRLLELTEAFSQNAATQHAVLCGLMAACWDRVLAPLQAAKFMVASYPHCPDMTRMLEALAALHGAADVQPQLVAALAKP